MYSNRKVSRDNVKLDTIPERNRELQAFAKSVGCLPPHIVATPVEAYFGGNMHNGPYKLIAPTLHVFNLRKLLLMAVIVA
ncbi:MAG: hypothetical protein K6T99_04925 [Armatimonadetes bacterium]|nr:hypothetical protein [Armatimonadota bacterium]